MLSLSSKQRYNCLVIPRFERSGLLPPGEHEASWDEVAQRLGGDEANGRRQRLLTGLLRMLLFLAEAGCETVWLDGSFVTREKWPRDFDLCYDASTVDLARLLPVLQDLSAGRRAQKLAFGGEALPADFPFDWGGGTVKDAFTRTRDGEVKGLIRLDLARARPEIEAFVLREQEKIAQETVAETTADPGDP